MRNSVGTAVVPLNAPWGGFRGGPRGLGTGRVPAGLCYWHLLLILPLVTDWLIRCVTMTYTSRGHLRLYDHCWFLNEKERSFIWLTALVSHFDTFVDAPCVSPHIIPAQVSKQSSGTCGGGKKGRSLCEISIWQRRWILFSSLHGTVDPI